MANLLLVLFATVSIPVWVGMGFGIWWYLLSGTRTVNLPTANDALVFTAEDPTVSVEAETPTAATPEAVVPSVEVAVEVTPVTGEDVVAEVDCD